MGCVYILVSPSKKVYVGKTVNKNLRSYIKRCAYEAEQGKNSKPKLYRAFRKYGLKNFRIHKLLESDDNVLLCAWEKFEIKSWDSIANGYNIAEGGEGAGYKHGPDCKHCLWARTKGAEVLRQARANRVYPPKKEKVLKGWTPEQRIAAAERMRQQLAAHPEWERGRGARARWKDHIKTTPVPTTPEERIKARKQKNGTSSFVGVHWEPSRNKWISKLFVNGKRHFLGRFDSEESAARAYNEAASRILSIGPVNLL